MCFVQSHCQRPAVYYLTPFRQFLKAAFHWVNHTLAVNFELLGGVTFGPELVPDVSNRLERVKTGRKSGFSVRKIGTPATRFYCQAKISPSELPQDLLLCSRHFTCQTFWQALKNNT